MAETVLNRINRLIPLGRLIRFLIGVSLAVQFIVILYNNLSGFYPLDSFTHFLRSYLFLQQIRYGEDLTWSVNIPSALLGMVLPPLSLQVVLENAIKHNIVNHPKPPPMISTPSGPSS